MQVKIPLLEIESTSIALHVAGISTITFFDGDIKVVEQIIKNKLNKIMKLNPWLCGKLIRENDSKRLKIAYDETQQSIDIDRIFQVNPVGMKINSSMDYESLCKMTRPFLVQSPSKSINNDKYVSSLILVNDSKEKNSKFALIFSISHSIGDGHTYYSLFNMLSNDEDARALHVERKEELMPELINSFGSKEYNYIKSLPHAINVLSGMFFGKKSKAFAYFIDEQKINEFKKECKFKNEKDFISTNDILTSTYSNFIDSRLTLMAINLRAKVQSLKEDDAGNYEGAVIYDKENYMDAIKIRNSLKLKPYKGLSKKLPSFFEGMFCKMGLITNWSSFCKDIKLQNSRQTLHLPITNSKSNAPYEMAVVFRPMADKLAIIYFTHKFEDKDFKASNLPLGEVIYS